MARFHKINASEHEEQTTLIKWCLVKGKPYNRIFAIPNGGSRHKAEAGKLRAEGVRAGVPDLFLPVARGGFHGLFIEMKSVAGYATPDQKREREDLEEAGYCALIIRGWEQAAQAIEEYLSL